MPTAEGMNLRALLFLDFGVLEHFHSAALNDFAAEGNGFSCISRQFLIHWLVVANDQIQLVILREQPNRAAGRNTFFSAPRVLFSFGPVVQVAH
jgi:hypothetical protein